MLNLPQRTLRSGLATRRTKGAKAPQGAFFVPPFHGGARAAFGLAGFAFGPRFANPRPAAWRLATHSGGFQTDQRNRP
jgi:hypothetical protein